MNPVALAKTSPAFLFLAIVRQGYFVTANNLKNGACPDGEKIPGIWK